jgi:hypothetical protein
MTKSQSDFQTLLSEAPIAPHTPEADIVTVVGILGRITDPERFLLTLPSGQSETLDVAAVKSAKKVASAIGSLVELELYADLVPQHMRAQGISPFVAALPHQADPRVMAALALSGTRTYITAYEWTSDNHTVFKVRADQPS